MALRPNELRTALCSDLAELERSAGHIPDTRGIENCVDHDVAVWAAQLREQKPHYTTGPQKRPEDEKHRLAKRTAEERSQKGRKIGQVKFKNNGEVDDEVKASCDCGGSACHFCKLQMRMTALMEKVPHAELNPHLPMSEAWKNCVHREFAKEIQQVWMWKFLNPHAQLLKAKGQLERVIIRKMEDIADRSATAIIGMGGWR